MKNHLLPLAFLSALSLTAGAQEATNNRQGLTPGEVLPPQSSPAGEFVADGATLKGVGLTEIDGQTVAVGPGYRSFYDAQRVLFHPALGTLAPTTQHLEFRLESIELGGEPLVTVTPTAPSVTGNTVTYDRGLVLERYEATSAGIEQTFTLLERQNAAGDLVVRGRIATSLPWDGVIDAKGLAFVDPIFGGVSIGGVTGVDANGATISGDVRFDGEHVEYVLPASFVANAAYPLVLDPLIGASGFIDNTDGSGRSAPDVAYNGDDDRYLAVWQVAYALNDFDIHAVERLGDGSFLSAVQVVRLTIGTVSAVPSVGYARGNGYIIAWSEGSLLGQRDIWGRAYRSMGAGFTDAGLIASGPTNQTNPAVGGDGFAGSAGLNAVVVWEDTTDGIWAAHVRPSATAAPIVTAVQLVMPGTEISNPAISESGGVSGNWVIAASRFYSMPAPGDTDIRFVIVEFANLNIVAGPMSITTLGINESSPSVDGNGTEFLLAYDTDELGNLDVRYVSVSASGTLGTVHDILSGNLVDQYGPEVAYTGNKYILTCEYSTLSGSNIAYQEICSSNFEVCQSFTPFQTTGFDRENLGLASKRSGDFDDTSDEGLFVWQDNDLDLEPSILAQPFDGSVGGLVENLGGGCGASITVSTLAPPSLGNAQFGWSLDVPMVSNFVLLNARLNPLAPFTCGSCQIQADLGIVLSAAVVGGNAQFFTPLPGDVGLLGQQVTTQFFVFPTFESPCTIFNNVSASDRIRVTVTN